MNSFTGIYEGFWSLTILWNFKNSCFLDHLLMTCFQKRHDPYVQYELTRKFSYLADDCNTTGNVKQKNICGRILCKDGLYLPVTLINFISTANVFVGF